MPKPRRSHCREGCEDDRGREIERRLAQGEYKDLIQTSEYQAAIDFISKDGSHTVSVKTVDVYSDNFSSGKWYYEKSAAEPFKHAVPHAQELVEAVPGARATLDIRVPPDTPSHVMAEIRETLVGEVQDPPGRLSIVVKTFP